MEIGQLWHYFIDKVMDIFWVIIDKIVYAIRLMADKYIEATFNFFLANSQGQLLLVMLMVAGAVYILVLVNRGSPNSIGNRFRRRLYGDGVDKEKEAYWQRYREEKGKFYEERRQEAYNRRVSRGRARHRASNASGSYGNTHYDFSQGKPSRGSGVGHHAGYGQKGRIRRDGSRDMSIPRGRWSWMRPNASYRGKRLSFNNKKQSPPHGVSNRSSDYGIGAYMGKKAKRRANFKAYQQTLVESGMSGRNLRGNLSRTRRKSNLKSVKRGNQLVWYGKSKKKYRRRLYGEYGGR